MKCNQCGKPSSLSLEGRPLCSECASAKIAGNDRIWKRDKVDSEKRQKKPQVMGN